MRNFIFLFMPFFIMASCSTKEKNSAFSQIIDYCEFKENHDDPYCKLGIHHKTIEEIKKIYGEPIISFDFFRLPLDTCGFENGAYTEKTLISLCYKFKGKETPPILSHTWDLGKDSLLDENIWLRIYFVEDEMKKYRAIYGQKAREAFFYYE